MIFTNILFIFSLSFFGHILEMQIHYTHSLRGRPAMVANGIRYLLMSNNNKRILWRCSYMATKSLKCPARITEYKETNDSPKRYVINKSEHIHAELKRGKYFVKPDVYTDYTMEEMVSGSDIEIMMPGMNE